MSDVYELYVPNVYVPEPTVMGEILQHLDLNGAVEHVPRMWSDMIIFDHHSRENLVEALLNIMVNNEQVEGSEFIQKFARIASDMYDRVRNQNENRKKKIKYAFSNTNSSVLMLIIFQHYWGLFGKNNDSGFEER